MSDAKKPWEETWRVTAYGATIGDAAGPPYAWCLGAVKTGESAAHAHEDIELCARATLAAAAPELYRALEVIIARTIMNCPDMSGEGRPPMKGAIVSGQTLNEARAALRKARGEP